MRNALIIAGAVITIVALGSTLRESPRNEAGFYEGPGKMTKGVAALFGLGVCLIVLGFLL